MAQVLVQNRVTRRLAAPARGRAPARRHHAEERRPTSLMVVHLLSPGQATTTQLYLGNYATSGQGRAGADRRASGRCQLFGRATTACASGSIPTRSPRAALTAGDVVARHPRAERAGRRRRRSASRRTPAGSDFQLDRQHPGPAASTEEQFGDIVIKTGADGQHHAPARRRPHRAGRRELRRCSSLLDNKPAVAHGDLPGARLQCAARSPTTCAQTMAELEEDFPGGHRIPHRLRPDGVRARVDQRGDPRRCSRRSLLVVLVVLLFLQTWRASIIPLLAVPVAIVGTFAVMLRVRLLAQHADAVRPGAGHRHRRRRRHRGGRKRRAPHRRRAVAARGRAIRPWSEVTGPVIAIALVLCAVFIPIAFITGITGQFYRQFALTIAVSTLISAFNSLTLVPALAALLLRPHDAPPDRPTRLPRSLLGLVVPALQPLLRARSRRATAGSRVA